MSSFSSLYFQALGCAAQARYQRDDVRWPARLRDLMGALTWREAPTERPLVSLTVIRSLREGFWRIQQRGAQFTWYHEDALLRELEWRIYAACAAESPASLLIHAGAVVRDGQALLLPGVSGAGKTTLTYALAARGWQTLSDDLLALDAAHTETPGALAALPCPRCGHVSPQSLQALAEIGVMPEGPVARLHGYYRPHTWAEPAPVRFVVAPRYQPDAACAVTPMSQAETAALLMSASFTQRRAEYRTQWRTAARVAAQTCGWRLTYSRLTDALDMIDQLAAERV
jgi:hypothetical protein